MTLQRMRLTGTSTSQKVVPIKDGSTAAGSTTKEQPSKGQKSKNNADDTRDCTDRTREKIDKALSGVKGVVESGFAIMAVYDLVTDFLAAYAFFNPQWAGTCLLDRSTRLYYDPVDYNPAKVLSTSGTNATTFMFEGALQTCPAAYSPAASGDWWRYWEQDDKEGLALQFCPEESNPCKPCDLCRPFFDLGAVSAIILWTTLRLFHIRFSNPGINRDRMWCCLLFVRCQFNCQKAMPNCNMTLTNID
jgi:hypothetical protein